jgi:hypothetical protein
MSTFSILPWAEIIFKEKYQLDRAAIASKTPNMKFPLPLPGSLSDSYGSPEIVKHEMQENA